MPLVKGVQPNQLAIEALPSRGTRYEISVVEHRGLIVRVLPSGEKRFVYRHRRKGRLHRAALAARDLRGAVREWAALRRDERLGIEATRLPHGGVTDDVPQLMRERPATIAQLIDAFVEVHAAPHKRAWRSDYNRLLRYVLPAWGPLDIRALRRGDVHALAFGLACRRPLQANRVLALVRRLLAFAVEAGVLDAHPCLACRVTHCVVPNRTPAGLVSAAAECARDTPSGAAPRPCVGHGPRAARPLKRTPRTP